MSTETHPLDIPAFLKLTPKQRRAAWDRFGPPGPKPSFGGGPQLTDTERAYRASIAREKAAKKAEGLAKLAAWKAAHPELVEAQKQVAKLKRRKRRKPK